MHQKSNGVMANSLLNHGSKKSQTSVVSCLFYILPIIIYIKRTATTNMEEGVRGSPIEHREMGCAKLLAVRLNLQS